MKKKLIAIVVLIAVVLTAAIFIAMNPTWQKKDRSWDVVISQENLLKHLHAMVDIQPPRSSQNWASLDKAADYIIKEWKAQGFEVEEQKYNVHGKEARNLIVRYKSIKTGGAKKTLIVGAHYDVCMDLPGADDNASGLSGLLEVTRVIQQLKPELDYDIEFVAYTLEEPPYYDTEWMGSYVHAKSVKERGLDVLAMISIEMIGYFTDEPNSQIFPIDLLKGLYPTVGNFIAVVAGHDDWNLTRQVKTLMQKNGDVPVKSFNTFTIIPGVDWSDHRSYWNQGYRAVMITDTSLFRNFNYHTEKDTIDRLNIPKMADVVGQIYGVTTGF